MPARRPSLSPSIVLATLLLALPVDLALTILHAYLLRYPRNPRCDFHPQPHLDLDPGLYGSRDGFATGIHSSKRMSESLGLPRCYCDTRVAASLQIFIDATDAHVEKKQVPAGARTPATPRLSRENTFCTV
ncbi:hypothetical protein B0H13DRAFT_2282989 [Mycena leptocephala]|nr:hypothetical protein B0H13DRAFT_2282989 [Mycena leptocephala]